MIPGTTRGTSTDVKGAYMLDLRNSEYLEFSCLGYKSQTVKVNGQAIINVVLEENMSHLDEIVVVGYGVQKRRDIVGAIETLNTEEIQERTGSTMGISRALQGAIPGLTLTFTDGKPSRGATIRIRGVENSIGSGGEALVLLDGMETSMDAVNPEDIESVTVLKDASSTAIYGSRGSFGVILLTSKSPQKGRTRITYDGSFNVYQRTVFPQVVSNGYEWTTNYLEAYMNDSGGSKPANINNVFPYSDEWYEELGRRNGNPNAENYWVNSSGKYQYFGNTDWYDMFYKKYWCGHQHNLTASGGSDVGSFYVSGRFFNQDGTLKVGDEKWDQYNLMAKGTVNIKPWLRVSETVDFMYRRTKEPGRFTSGTTPSLIPHMLEEEFFPVCVPYNPDGTWTANACYGYAQLVEDNQYVIKKTTQFSTRTGIDLDIIKDVLWVSGNLSYKFSNHDYDTTIHQVSYSASPGVMTDEPANSYYIVQSGNDQRITGDVSVNYAPRLGENNSLSFILGWNIEDYHYSATTIKRSDMINDVGTANWDLMEGEVMSISDGGSYSCGLVGAFYRINYSYKSKYLVETSGRYDGNSKFPRGQQWGFFPSGSVGWRISEEGFMKSADWLDNLKIRFSVGSAGNGLISNAYAYLSTMSLSQSTMLNNGSNFKYTSAPSPVPDGLTWEKVITYDLGLDFEALDGRLNFVGDIYRKNTNDMYVVGEELPAVYGNSAPKGNYADMRTDGWELSAGWRDSYIVGGKRLSYNIKAAVWNSLSKITRYTSKSGTLPTITSVAYYEGMTLGEIWGYVCNGLFQSWDEIENSADMKGSFTYDSVTLSPGDTKFEDLNGDGVVNNGAGTIYDHGDMVKIGNTSPRYCYSFQGGISWNGIGLSFMFQGVGKRDWYPAAQSGLFWGQYHRPYGQMYRWQDEAHRWSEDNPDAYWPRLIGYAGLKANSQLTHANTRYLQNASYLRLKNVTVDYSFPSKIVQKMGLQALKIYVTLENPLTFSPLHKYAKNYDPENIYAGDADFDSTVGGQGTGDGVGYSVLKSYSIGLSITL